MVPAPSSTARPTGIECTSPPSKKCSPSTSTGGSSPGTAHEASTAGTSGPALNQCALARSMLAATQCSGTTRSAKSAAGSASASMRRNGSISCRCVPDLASRVARPSSVPLNARCRWAPCQSSPSRSAAPAGSAATNAPLIAPTEVPTTTSGTMPASARARSMPTSCAPSTPPPPSTNAVFTCQPPRPPPLPGYNLQAVAALLTVGDEPGPAQDRRGGLHPALDQRQARVVLPGDRHPAGQHRPVTAAAAELRPGGRPPQLGHAVNPRAAREAGRLHVHEREDAEVRAVRQPGPDVRELAADVGLVRRAPVAPHLGVHELACPHAGLVGDDLRAHPGRRAELRQAIGHVIAEDLAGFGQRGSAREQSRLGPGRPGPGRDPPVDMGVPPRPGLPGDLADQVVHRPVRP